jgi:hypothetical protein
MEFNEIFPANAEALIVPEILVSPITVNVADGFVVPIPTFSFDNTKSSLNVMRFFAIFPFSSLYVYLCFIESVI